MRDYDHVNALLSGGRTESALWKPVDQRYSNVRLLPANPFMHKTFRHWNVVEKKLVRCLGSGCPICAVARAVKEAATRFTEKSEPRRMLEKGVRDIKCEAKVAFPVAVEMPDGTWQSRVWATTGANENKIATQVEAYKQDDPAFDPCDFNLSVGFFNNKRPQEKYQIMFKGVAAGGQTPIPLDDWESKLHNLAEAVENNYVDLEEAQAIEIMQQSHGALLAKLGLPTVAELVANGGGGGGGGGMETTSVDSMLNMLERVDTAAPIPTPAQQAEAPPTEAAAPDAAADTQALMDKLD